ncbi:L-aminoadipate-semialdehyde dehydrogenase-phosphopantetheinyl transferase isoform X2 [Oncorhynchus mykiss]|uniref:L-aminoadipate-semialdehyde dehydrogenase-phosphopantetheinyl transferase isoform X2 n=1 Tax=Oncorhynchus mykiss TaxID=8022 RepID=UPI0018779544|nr:L-aminoadipate-semialdehyde dehydrogenase-phosphopantetheinyl transferase isoform X2 [Oncorhynchus mykiss]
MRSVLSSCITRGNVSLKRNVGLPVLSSETGRHGRRSLGVPVWLVDAEPVRVAVSGPVCAARRERTNRTVHVCQRCQISYGSTSVPEFFRIMTRQFTDCEWSVIRSAGSEWEQLTMFYRHWALKESFIKAIGTGLGFNLQRAEFHLSPEPITEGKVCRRTTMHLDEEEEEVWAFEETVLGKDHHVAVALGPSHTVRSVPPPALTDPPPSFTFLSFSDLISMATPLFEEDSAYWENFQKKAEAPERQRLTATV